jgi:hypothetical protein
MTRTFFDIKAEEIKNPRPTNFNDEMPWNPLSPRREVIQAYLEVDFPYEITIQDRVASRWYAAVKNRTDKITQEIVQIYRRRIPNQGDFVFYNVHLYGDDWKGNEHCLPLVMGKYMLPIFKREKNPETEKVTTNEVMDQRIVYDIPWTKEGFDKLVKSSIDPVSLIVYGSAGRRLGISSLEDFREGTTDDLIQCGTRGKSLESVLAEKNQFYYDKREKSIRQPTQKIP